MLYLQFETFLLKIIGCRLPAVQRIEPIQLNHEVAALAVVNNLQSEDSSRLFLEVTFHMAAGATF